MTDMCATPRNCIFGYRGGDAVSRRYKAPMDRNTMRSVTQYAAAEYRRIIRRGRIWYVESRRRPAAAIIERSQGNG